MIRKFVTDVFLFAWKPVAIGLTCGLVICLILPTDDTDAGRFERSGMTLHVDHGTGCHYLSRWFGEPVPRLDGEGNQVGCHGVSP